MKINEITKHKLLEALGILIYFLIIGLIGYLTNYRSNDFPLLRGIISIVIFGFLTALFELYISRKLIRLSFAVNFIVAILYYYLTFSLVIVGMGYATLVYKEGMSWSNALATNYYDLFPYGIGQPMFILGLAVFLLILIRYSSTMLGREVILKYFSGKYHRPRNENRVFMFLDLKSSTEIAEKLGHQKYSAFLKDFFNRLDEPILASKGFLFQYVGDELVMVWSYKKAFNNNNVIKFYTMVKQLLDETADEFLTKYGIKPEYKAGIHCGEVSVTEIGSIRKSLAYHGDPINTASRICAKCKELNEELLISEDVYERINKDMDFNCKSIGEFELKGKKNKVKLYKVFTN